ncbi:hypothetical protein Tco_0037846 [Tanacetum coccineum]
MWLRRGDDGGGVAGLRGTPAGGEGKWRVRSGGDGGIWQRREWLVRSYGDSSGGSQMAAGGGMATRGACCVLPLASSESLECLDTLSNLVRAVVSPMVSWHQGPPPELVPWELDSLGVALDWVLFMLPPSCYASKLEAVVAALTKLSPKCLWTASSATFLIGSLG